MYFLMSIITKGGGLNDSLLYSNTCVYRSWTQTVLVVEQVAVLTKGNTEGRTHTLPPRVRRGCFM